MAVGLCIYTTCQYRLVHLPTANCRISNIFSHSPLLPIVTFNVLIVFNSGPGSSVGIATDYWLEGPESNLGEEEIFPPVQTGPGAHPASYTMDTGCFLGVKCGRGVLLNTHPLLVPRSWKSRAIPLPTLWATPGL